MNENDKPSDGLSVLWLLDLSVFFVFLLYWPLYPLGVCLRQQHQQHHKSDNDEDGSEGECRGRRQRKRQGQGLKTHLCLEPPVCFLFYSILILLITFTYRLCIWPSQPEQQMQDNEQQQLPSCWLPCHHYQKQPPTATMITTTTHDTTSNTHKKDPNNGLYCRLSLRYFFFLLIPYY